MLLKADAKQLEWRVALFLSQDKVGIQEILDGVDIHEVNRQELDLPTRLIAKTFLFRLIYGGSCWAYAKDSEFNYITKDPDYWQGVIDETYKKYKGLAKWHGELVNQAIREGFIRIPSQRIFCFRPSQGKFGIEWPRTKILNYPVQGLSADLMAIARVSTKKRLAKYGKNVLLINTVHDDIELEVEERVVDVQEVAEVLKEVFFDLGGNFSRIYLSNDNRKWNVPLACDVFCGKNLSELKEL